MNMLMEQPDIRVQDEGNIFLLHPITAKAQEWMDETLGETMEPWQQFGTGYVVEHRYVAVILQDMIRDGLTVS
jgi:hypothetical protein